MTIRSVRSAASRLAVALFAVAGIAASDANLANEPRQSREAVFVPDPRAARIGAFGFHAVLADFYWLRAVQIVGSEAGPIGQSHTLGALIDVVTTLDPSVDHAYRFAGVWLNDDAAAVRKGNEILARGIAQHPHDWRNYFYAAFNHFFYLGEQAEAAAVLAPAVGLEGAPPYLGRLAARLESHAAGLDAASAFLTELLREATDPRKRQHYEEALRQIETERRARVIDAARAEYVRRFRRDITRVDELVSSGVLRVLPRDPFGRGWEIDADSGEVVSSYVRYRYRLQTPPGSEPKLAKFRDPTS